MTIGKRARKWFCENVLKSDVRVYLDKCLIKIIDDIVSYMSSNYFGIGKCSIEDYLFCEYVDIANSIYRRYGRKLPIDAFSNMIIKKINEDGRLELITDEKYIFPSKAEADKLYVYTEVRAKVFGKIRKYKYPIGADVYWNSGVTIDNEFIKNYIKKFFYTKIKNEFWANFRRSAKDFGFKICDFKHSLSMILCSDEIECLIHFAKISKEEIVEEIKCLAEAEDLIMITEEFNDVKLYYLSVK